MSAELQSPATTPSAWVQAKTVCELVYDLSPYADFAEVREMLGDLKAEAAELGYPIRDLPSRPRRDRQEADRNRRQRRGGIR